MRFRAFLFTFIAKRHKAKLIVSVHLLIFQKTLCRNDIYSYVCSQDRGKWCLVQLLKSFINVKVSGP